MTLEPIQFLFDDNINIYLQSYGNAFVDSLFKTITALGSEPVYVFLASLIFWCFNKKTGLRVMYVILFSAFATILAKNLFAMPRPPEYLHKIEENEFGFPSGHAMVSSGFWGYLGFDTRNKRLIFVGIVAILSVSLSRVYLGVHYAGDVMGGIVFGLSVAFISYKANAKIIRDLEKLNRTSKYFVAIIIPVLLVSIASMQHSLLKEQVEIGLVMAGISVGYLLEEEYIGLRDADNNRQRIKRAVVGVAILGFVYLVSGILLFINPDFFFFKYAVLGFASTFIVPWAFMKVEVSLK